MNQKLIFLLILTTAMNLCLFAIKKNKSKSEPLPVSSPISSVVIPQPVVSPPAIPPTIPRLVPKFENYAPVRGVDSSLGKVLGDIESHMPAGHIYADSDKITWAHETTHGINSNARMKFSRGTTYAVLENIIQEPSGRFFRVYKYYGNNQINAFYVLENKVVVIQEPNTRIRSVAAKVPSSLRGGVYNLYLVQQAGSWDDTPLYIFDEWSAYTNGSACRLDLKIQSRSETVQYMLEFNVYSSCVAWTSGSNDPQLKAFLMWQTERAMNIYKESTNVDGASSYLEKMRTSSDATQWRGFCKEYFGSEWCKEVFGF